MENLIKGVVNYVKQVVNDDRVLIRTILLLGVLLVMTLLTMEYIRRVWKDDFELRAPGVNGAVVFHSSYDDDFRKVIFLVPASQCWVNTGLEFKPGDKISFKTSGQVHLAQNLIRQEEISKVSWSNPAGSPFIELMTTKKSSPNNERDKSKRSDFLIIRYPDPNTSYPLVGNLVGYLQVVGIDDEPGPTNPHPASENENRVFHIGAEKIVTNETGHHATLWLTVNDIVLDGSDEAKHAYVGDSTDFVSKELEYPPYNRYDSLIRTTSAIDKWKMHRSYWDTIINRHKWDIFFNDNIGTYLVFIEKLPRRNL